MVLSDGCQQKCPTCPWSPSKPLSHSNASTCLTIIRMNCTNKTEHRLEGIERPAPKSQSKVLTASGEKNVMLMFSKEEKCLQKFFATLNLENGSPPGKLPNVIHGKKSVSAYHSGGFRKSWGVLPNPNSIFRELNHPASLAYPHDLGLSWVLRDPPPVTCLLLEELPRCLLNGMNFMRSIAGWKIHLEMDDFLVPPMT